MITSSTFTEGPDQGDGRRYVKETHVDDAGSVYDYDWLGSQPAEPVLAARAAVLNNLISERRAAEALVAGTRLPLTKLQFRQVFTSAERTGIDAFEASFETMPGLDPGAKALVRTGFKDFNAATQINVPFLPPVLDMLELFAQLGLLTAERVAEITGSYGG